MQKKCRICSFDSNQNMFIHGHGFEIVSCGNCGIMYEDHDGSVKPDTDPYSDLYNTDPGVQNISSVFLNKYLSDLFFRIATNIEHKASGKGSLLDIGCAFGYLVYYMQCRGWDAQGIDISHNAITWAQSQGLNCCVSSIEDFKPDKKFDVIVMRHVLEHLVSPLEVLKVIKDWLSPEGFIYIIVPNANSNLFKLSKNCFVGHLKPFEHLFFFSEESFKSTCEMAGLSCLCEKGERHKLSEIVNYWIRSKLVLRKSWIATRYGATNQTRKRFKTTLCIYQKLISIMGGIPIGVADKELMGYVFLKSYHL